MGNFVLHSCNLKNVHLGKSKLSMKKTTRIQSAYKTHVYFDSNCALTSVHTCKGTIQIKIKYVCVQGKQFGYLITHVLYENNKKN
jgi:NAD(P)H-flavin reductase